MKADYTLSTSLFTAFSPEVGERVARVPEVGVASAFRTERVRVNGSTSFVTAVDPATVEEVTLEVSEGEVGALAEGGANVLVHGDVAGTAPAGCSATRCPRSSRPLARCRSIVGIYDENRLVGDYVISLGSYRGCTTSSSMPSCS